MKKYESYYDGRHIDSGKTQEEKNKAEELAFKEDEKLKSWDDVEL